MSTKTRRIIEKDRTLLLGHEEAYSSSWIRHNPVAYQMVLDGLEAAKRGDIVPTPDFKADFEEFADAYCDQLPEDV